MKQFESGPKSKFEQLEVTWPLILVKNSGRPKLKQKAYACFDLFWTGSKNGPTRIFQKLDQQRKNLDSEKNGILQSLRKLPDKN